MANEDELTQQSLVDRLTLANIYCVALTGELESGEEADVFTVNLEPSSRALPGRFDYLYQATCEAKTDSGERVASLGTSIIVTFDVDDEIETSSVSQELIDWVGANIARFAVYPYVRESLQGIAARLGIQSLTMDLLKRGEPLPEGLSFGSAPTAPSAPVD
ncbi:hypothetical protein [Pimelobacter simplex]|uniref:hypothetical protein n=1 Tax=Nocardioides simplex TaxID=2045 RepID=UPI003AAEB167